MHKQNRDHNSSALCLSDVAHWRSFIQSVITASRFVHQQNSEVPLSFSSIFFFTPSPLTNIIYSMDGWLKARSHSTTTNTSYLIGTQSKDFRVTAERWIWMLLQVRLKKVRETNVKDRLPASVGSVIPLRNKKKSLKPQDWLNFLIYLLLKCNVFQKSHLWNHNRYSACWMFCLLEPSSRNKSLSGRAVIFF